MAIFNADPAPDNGDGEGMSLRKICKLLNDAFGGGAASPGPAPRRAAFVDKSGTCTGASQIVSAANTGRNYFTYQNPSGNAGTQWVSLIGGTAVAHSPCIEVKPGQGLALKGVLPTAAITMIGTNTEKFTAYEA